MASAETAAEHERILREIESTDTNCIGPTLRSVYDGQEHGFFMEKLEGRIRNHDREIEKMCNHHFQGFVDSITELLKVRGEAQKLKGQVTETNQKLQNNGKELLATMDELRRCRLQQRNIATTIDKLTHCLPVLEMYSRLQEQMRAKRYYPALCTLEQLEQNCLPKAGQYRFCAIMAENIPILRTHIRDVSMSDLKDFLESIRKHSDKIGETAIKQAQVRSSRNSAVTRQQRAGSGWRLRKEAGSGTEVDWSGGSPLSEEDSGILDVEDEDDDEVPGAQDLVDFSPVYRCLHIYTVLGYGFPVNQLFDMVLEMRDQYGEILLKKWNQSFRQILDQDNYSPIPTATEEEYRQITSQFPFQDPELDMMPFPKKFPFSEFVPKVYTQLKEFIYACLKYSEDLHLSSTEIDDMIRKSTNLLLTRTLSNSLQYAIKKKNVGLAELVQIIVNTTHLEMSCHYLEEFISNITNVPPDTVNTTKLYGTSTFKDARHAAEEEIYTNLNLKIDQFLQLADYDWMAAQGGGQASDYLSDLIAFLCSTFAVFTHLPGKVAQTACMSACKHLSTSLLQLLLEADVRQVSMGALQQFNVDVRECERFARAGPVPGFQGDTLLLAFIDLRQLLDLFTQWDWPTYLADYGRPTCKYLRVSPHTALALLEKMKDTSRKNNMFAQFRKNERDKQKLIDTVVKQLRNLIASHQS
ncbi:exocyst complex component 6B isoform X4 [Neoarius graeffei]|uniref:exocyst complex component 6B isoform X4 n=1 Tax=Neoarius graeffei TaxID=443677 RepID=UPI00298C42EC|nr:exocyst complex component 6B isoform X4 [Neoarius graeffei]